MDHAKAIETNAAERYLLGELDDSEAEMYEEHFFECAACAEDVRDGMRLIEGIRDVESGKRRPDAEPAPVVAIDPRRARRIGWMQIAAAAVLAVGIAVPQLVPSREVAIVGTPVSLTASRAAAAQTFPANKHFVAEFDVLAPVDEAVGYELRIVDAQTRKKVRDLRTITAKEAQETVSFVSELPAGRYKLLVTGVQADGNRAVPEEYEFHVVE
ncbi:MAG TPA: hypothetical protein VFO89_15645 [Thermoanaerobaculia bacterium]|nr:hypothetical protein [Thermoanaerobaculia bacterium]